ncbi:MAG: hypothetical protein WC326_15810 [Candidatus Delongbacteria bacterium]
MRRLLTTTLLLAAAAAWASGEPALESAGAADGGRPERVATPTQALARDQRAALEALESQAATAADPEGLQRQIIELKQQHELRRLELLAETCRLAGRTEEAELAESRLAELRNPVRSESFQPRLVSLEDKLAAQERAARAAETTPTPADPAAPSSTEGGSR